MFVALFNEEEYNDDSAPLEKLENVAKVLLTVPAGMNQSVSSQVLPRKLFLIVSFFPLGLLSKCGFSAS